MTPLTPNQIFMLEINGGVRAQKTATVKALPLQFSILKKGKN